MKTRSTIIRVQVSAFALADQVASSLPLNRQREAYASQVWSFQPPPAIELPIFKVHPPRIVDRAPFVHPTSAFVALQTIPLHIQAARVFLLWLALSPRAHRKRVRQTLILSCLLSLLSGVRASF